MDELLDRPKSEPLGSDAGAESVTTHSTWVINDKLVGPVVVTPLREFGRRVIDPIVEFARRPTELRTIPDLFFPPFKATEEVEESATVWVLPTSLLASLDRLAAYPDLTDWTRRVASLIHELPETDGAARPTAAVLGDLRDAIDENVMPTVEDPPTKAELQRTRYALLRRLELWDRVAQIGDIDGAATVATTSVQTSRHDGLARCLDEVEQLTATVNAGDAWREYLLVDRLRAIDRNEGPAGQSPKELAEQVLSRLNTHRLSAKQRQFADKSPIARLSDELRGIAAKPVEMKRFLTHLERYEQTQLASDAKLVADNCRSLRWTSDPTARDMGEQADLYYRNANVRISVAARFVNRFVPQPTAVSARVSDMIQGVPVKGRSTTFTQIALRMIPDPHRIRIGLEADGLVASDTTSDAGPATFYNKAESSFQVRKLVLFNPSGMRLWPAVSDANSYYSDLTDVETSFDIVPLVGPLVRNIARSQHDEAQPDARREVESKVATRARRQFDDEVTPRLEKMVAKADADVLEPLRQLALEPTVLDMQTTDDRFIVRSRLAGDEQLGAHTPRPRAFSDSIVSLQVHQSALNNVLESLDLEGREFTVPELYQWLGRKLGRPIKQPEDVPDEVVVRFADRDAIRVDAVEGRMELAIGIAKLTYVKKRWRDFVVKTTYEPDPTSLEGRFVRTGGIFLEGKSLQGRAEFVLRSILSKALSADRPWRIVPEKYAADPRMADLEVSQFVVEDGWIGLAYAPRRVTTETARKGKETAR